MSSFEHGNYGNKQVITTYMSLYCIGYNNLYVGMILVIITYMLA